MFFKKKDKKASYLTVNSWISQHRFPLGRLVNKERFPMYMLLFNFFLGLNFIFLCFLVW